MSIETLLRRRISRVNNIKIVELIHHKIDDKGGYVAFRLQGRGVIQTVIPAPCVKALLSGRRSENLDSHLRP